jgi:hypothetical protein
MPEKKIDFEVLPDDTFNVYTPDEGQPYFAESRAREDAELQAALDTLRATGVNHPVVFQLGDDDPRSLELWKMLLPALKQHGIATWSATAQGPDDEHHYVMRQDRARELLRDVLRVRKAARLFRTPGFPVGYWTLSCEDGAVADWESRTFKDMGK